jgi:hypothetical protein
MNQNGIIPFTSFFYRTVRIRTALNKLYNMFAKKIFSNSWCSQIFISTFVVFVDDYICHTSVEKMLVLK